MNINNALRGTCALATLFVSGNCFAFGGMIAVGMNEAHEVGGVTVSFTADAKLQSEDFNLDTRIYFEEGKLRDEINISGQNMVYIQRYDLGTTWILMPQGMYMEVPQGQESDQVQEYRLIEREIVGKETINGMDTTKYSAVYETSDGRYSGFTWFTDENIAVKSSMVTESGANKTEINFEMSNLQFGAVDDSLFELPAGAQKLDIAAMMSAFGQAGGAAGALGGAGAPGAAAPSPEPAPAAPQAPGIAGEIADAAKQGAEDAAVEETRRGVRDAVGGRIRGIFNRD